MALTAASQASQDRQKTLPILNTLLSLIGVAGVLSATGYLVQVSTQRFLGISYEVPSPTRLVFVAGDFLLQTLLLSVDFVSRYWLLILTVAVIAFALFVIKAKSKYKSKFPLSQSSTLLCMAVITLSIIQMLMWDLPVTHLRDALIVSPTSQPNCGNDTIVLRRAHDLWAEVVASRKDSPNRNNEVVRLHNTYVSNVLLSGVSSIFLIAAIREHQQRPARAALRRVSIGLFLVALIFLPYDYGTLVRPTKFPKCIVTFQQPLPQGAGQTLPFISASYLGQDDKFVLLFDLPTRQVKSVPRDSVATLMLQDSSDILADLINLNTEPIKPIVTAR